MSNVNEYNSVPKSSTARKKVVWKRITISDLVFIFLIFVCMFAIPFPIPKITWLLKIIICLSIGVVCSLLLIRNKKTGFRYYKQVWLVCKFLFIKKKYRKTEIEKTLSKTEIEKDCIKQSYNNKNSYVRVLKINGFDLLNSNTDDQIHYVNVFHLILKNNIKNTTLIKIKEAHNWDLNIDEIYKKIDELKQKKDSFNSEQAYKAKLNQLKLLLDWYYAEKEKNNFTCNNWYLFVYGDNVEELNKNITKAYDNWSRLFFVEYLDIQKSTEILSAIWEPLKKGWDITENNSFLQTPIEDTKFYADYFKMGQNKYYSIGTLSVEQFPIKTDIFWLSRLAKCDDTTLIINLDVIKSEFAKKIIQKTINNTAYQENQINQYKQAIEKSEVQQQLEVVESVKDNIASGREILINANIYFLNYGKNQSELKMNIGKLKQLIKSENMVYNPLSYRQKEFINSIIPNGFEPKAASESIVFPALPLASSFPIQESLQIDNTGCILGINYNNNPVVLDVNLRTNKRINSNGLIVGISGSGKTTTMKKIINNVLAFDGVVYCIDPEQDYVHLAKYYDGKVIDAANGNKAKINPLQILLNESDDDDENINNNLISTHISLLMQWFKLLDLNLDDNLYEKLKNIIIELYRDYGLFEKNLYSLNPEDFPTFKELIFFIDKQIEKSKTLRLSDDLNSIFEKSNDLLILKSTQELMMIKEIIKNNFMNGGVYDSLYNGVSTLKIGNDNIVTFDVKNLLAISSPKRKVAQMILIIAYIQNAINLNGYSKIPKKTLLVVDEAHLFIDAKYPDVLVFLSQMSKRIRKRNGGVWITTQNPSDFIATEDIVRYTKSLMENAQYTIIQSLKPNDANAIVEMYKNTPNPITDAEKNFIQQDKKGQALLIVSNKLRQCLSIDVWDEEFLAIGESPIDKFNLSKIDMNIDFDYFDVENNDELYEIIKEFNDAMENNTLNNNLGFDYDYEEIVLN